MTALIASASSIVAGAQQHDTTHHMAPGMKMPGTPQKPAATPTKTKTAPTKAATKKAVSKTTPGGPTKTAAPPRTTSDQRIRVEKAPSGHDSVTAMPDSMHALMADTSHAQMHDSSHARMPDTMHMQMPDTTHMRMRDSSRMQMPDTMQIAAADTMRMAVSMDGPLGISMERMGSGTTWTPDGVMLPSRHFTLAGWGVMVHGFVFGQYDKQGGPRGDEQLGSLNWAMVMADHPFAGGRLQLRFMPSLDVATVGKCGYPLLLQSGETCNGQPLADRQHPHDFFMELGALFERAITSTTALLLYAAPAGEPALGPVAFMHRPSAMDVPFAPLGHHWQDATHISFGVVTTGIYTRQFRLEASAFNGIEPDEDRWDFDHIRINSYSTRLTVNPNRNLSFTAGYGSIAEPEMGNPNALMHRLVASAMHGRKLGADGQWATTVVYGANKMEVWTSSALIESEAVLDRWNTLFGRAEVIQKSAADLVLSGFDPDQRFNVGSASLGYIRELARGRDVTIGFGANGTLNVVPALLESEYGSRAPLAAMVFIRLRPYHSPHARAGVGVAGPSHEH